MPSQRRSSTAPGKDSEPDLDYVGPYVLFDPYSAEKNDAPARYVNDPYRQNDPFRLNSAYAQSPRSADPTAGLPKAPNADKKPSSQRSRR